MVCVRPPGAPVGRGTSAPAVSSRDRPYIYHAISVDNVEIIVEVDGRVGVGRDEAHAIADARPARGAGQIDDGVLIVQRRHGRSLDTGLA